VLELPKGAKLLTVQIQGHDPCLWYERELDFPLEPRTIKTFGTGHEMPKDEVLRYISTYQLIGGQLVFHVFEQVS
jgi:hypothetical protein